VGAIVGVGTRDKSVPVGAGGLNGLVAIEALRHRKTTPRIVIDNLRGMLMYNRYNTEDIIGCETLVNVWTTDAKRCVNREGRNAGRRRHGEEEDSNEETRCWWLAEGYIPAKSRQ